MRRRCQALAALVAAQVVVLTAAIEPAGAQGEDDLEAQAEAAVEVLEQLEESDENLLPEEIDAFDELGANPFSPTPRDGIRR